MRHYEFLFILKPTLKDEEIKAKIESMISTVTKNGGDVAKYDEIGIKSLAYEIQKHKRGYYTVLYFQVAPTSIKEIERIARLNEDLLRFLTIKYNSKKEIALWEKITKPITPKVEEKVENSEDLQPQEETKTETKTEIETE